MARIAVTSCVYLGDVAPYIPVARRLCADGHDVVFVAPEGFRSLLEPEPFEFHPYAMDCSPATMHADPEHTTLMRHPVRNVSKLGQYWMDRSFTDDPDTALRSMQEGFDGADAVVTHPTMGVLSVPVARSMGVPIVAGHLFPMMIPTDHWTPPLGSRSLRGPKPVNRAAWEVLRRRGARAFRDDKINEVRDRLGFPPIRCNGGWAWTEADATVVLVSGHYYGSGAPDWPPVTWGGFSIWQGPDGQELTPELDAHVGDGDPPVLVMLGTAAASGAGQQFARIAADLDRRGLRSVLLVGDPANLAAVSDRPGAATFAPITALLPRCQVAVVSGALGGVAAALSAGIPVVIHPQLFDQVWHGRRVEELGVGLMARRTSQVADAVRRISDDPAYAERARALAARMAGEDGPGVLAHTVEALLTV
ncbi:MAG: glycosyltransferase [Microthrixaceae bacterium]